MGTKEKKDNILLNSKVFEVSLVSSKHKKKVSFADNDVFHEVKIAKKQRDKYIKNVDETIKNPNRNM